MFNKAIALSAAKLFEKICSFLIIITLTYIFSQKEVGRFFYYFSLVSLLIPVMDFGLRKILVIQWDEGDPQKNSYLMSSVLLTKLGLGIVCFGLVLLVDFLINNQSFEPLACLLCFLAIFSDELGQIFRAPDHARGKYNYEIFAPLTSKALCLLTILYFKEHIHNIETALFVYAVWNFFGAVVSSFSFAGYNPVYKSGHFSSHCKGYLKEGYAFSLTGIFVMISFYVDSVILGAFSMEETGVYNCAFRIVLVFGILSSGFSHVLFSKFAQHNNRELKDSEKYLSKATPLVVTLFLSIAIGTVALSHQAVSFIYGPEFQEASQILILLAPFIFLSALSNIFAHTLEAHGLQKKVMRFNIVSCSFNLVTNLIFIPVWGMYAAAVTTVLTEVISVSLCYLLLKNSGVNPFSYFPKICKVLIVLVLVAGVVVYYLPLVPGVILVSAVFIPLYIKIFKSTQQSKGGMQCVS